jgi:hypothetical protein
MWRWTFESVLPTKDKHVQRNCGQLTVTFFWNPEMQLRLVAHWLIQVMNVVNTNTVDYLLHIPT